MDEMNSVNVTTICDGLINDLESSIDPNKEYSSLLQGTRNPFLTFSSRAETSGARTWGDTTNSSIKVADVVSNIVNPNYSLIIEAEDGDGGKEEVAIDISEYASGWESAEVLTGNDVSLSNWAVSPVKQEPPTPKTQENKVFTPTKSVSEDDEVKEQLNNSSDFVSIKPCKVLMDRLNLNNHLESLASSIDPMLVTLEKHFCEYCSEVFASIELLACHRKTTHYKEEILHCKKCSLSYEDKHSFLLHIKAKHDGKAPSPIKPVHVCEKCKKQFIYKQTLANHIVREHPVEEMRLEKSPKPHLLDPATRRMNVPSLSSLKCPGCKEVFENKITLHAHMSKYKCGILEQSQAAAKKLLSDTLVAVMSKKICVGTAKKELVTLKPPETEVTIAVAPKEQLGESSLTSNIVIEKTSLTSNIVIEKTISQEPQAAQKDDDEIQIISSKTVPRIYKSIKGKNCGYILNKHPNNICANPSMGALISPYRQPLFQNSSAIQLVSVDNFRSGTSNTKTYAAAIRDTTQKLKKSLLNHSKNKSAPSNGSAIVVRKPSILKLPRQFGPLPAPSRNYGEITTKQILPKFSQQDKQSPATLAATSGEVQVIQRQMILKIPKQIQQPAAQPYLQRIVSYNGCSYKVIEPKKYACNRCSAKLATALELRKHVALEHIHRCQKCGEGLLPEKLASHKCALHKCPICNNTYICSEAVLKAHLLKEHGIKSLTQLADMTALLVERSYSSAQATPTQVIEVATEEVTTCEPTSTTSDEFVELNVETVSDKGVENEKLTVQLVFADTTPKEMEENKAQLVKVGSTEDSSKIELDANKEANNAEITPLAIENLTALQPLMNPLLKKYSTKMVKNAGGPASRHARLIQKRLLAKARCLAKDASKPGRRKRLPGFYKCRYCDFTGAYNVNINHHTRYKHPEMILQNKHKHRGSKMVKRLVNPQPITKSKNDQSAASVLLPQASSNEVSLSAISNGNYNILLGSDIYEYQCSQCLIFFSSLIDLQAHRLLHDTAKPTAKKRKKQAAMEDEPKKKIAMQIVTKRASKIAMEINLMDEILSDAIHPSQDGEPIDDTETASASGVEADATDFLCDECFKSFDSLEEQQLHLEEVHGREDYQHSLSPHNTNLLINSRKIKSKTKICDKCGEIFHKLTDIYKHMTFHLVTTKNTQPFKSRQVVCKLCKEELQETFLYSHLLQSHSNFNSTEVPLSCPICSFHCSDASHFYQHLRLRHAKSILECEPCQMAFKSLEFLKKHAIEQHSIDLDKYSTVPIRLTRSSTVAQQKVLMVAKKKGRARKSDQSPIQLTPDITSNKLFICNECNIFYTEKAQLQNHLVNSCKGVPKVGRRPIPIKCTFCKEIYGNMYVYSAHLILQHSHHKAPSNIRCPECKAMFSNCLEICHHVASKHKIPYFGCLVCNKTFSNFSSLRSHLYSEHKIDLTNHSSADTSLIFYKRPPCTEKACPELETKQHEHRATEKKNVLGKNNSKTANKCKKIYNCNNEKPSFPEQLLPDVSTSPPKTMESVQKLSTDDEFSPKEIPSNKPPPETVLSPKIPKSESAKCAQVLPSEDTISPIMVMSSLKDLSTKAVSALKESTRPLDTPAPKCDANLTEEVTSEVPEPPSASPTPSLDLSKETTLMADETLIVEDVKLSAPALVKILRIPSLDAKVMSSVQLPKGTKELNLQDVLSSMAALNGKMVPKMSTLGGSCGENKQVTSKLCKNWVTMRTKLCKNFYKDLCGRWQCRVCKFQTVSLSIIRFHTTKNHTEEALKAPQPLSNRFIASSENNLKVKSSIIQTLSLQKTESQSLSGNAGVIRPVREHLSCSDCTKNFSSPRALKMHRICMHDIEKSSKGPTTAAANVFCENCKRAFKTLFALKVHKGKNLACQSTLMVPKLEQEEKDEEQTAVVKKEPDVVMETDPTRIKEECAKLLLPASDFPHEVSDMSDDEDDLIVYPNKSIEQRIFCTNCFKDFPVEVFTMHMVDCYRSKLGVKVPCSLCDQIVNGACLVAHTAKHLSETSDKEPVACNLCKIVLLNKCNHLHHSLEVHM